MPIAQGVRERRKQHKETIQVCLTTKRDSYGLRCSFLEKHDVIKKGTEGKDRADRFCPYYAPISQCNTLVYLLRSTHASIKMMRK